MVRFYLIVLVTLLIAVCSSCPRPITEQGDRAPAGFKSATNTPGSQTEPWTNPVDEADGEKTTEDPRNDGQGVDGYIVTTPESETTGPTEGLIDGGTEQAGDGEKGGTGQGQELEISEDSPAADFTPPTLEVDPPALKLSDEAIRFAGSYVVVSVTSNSESEPVEAGWFMNFGADGNYEGLDPASAASPLCSGIWSMADGQIVIAFGPAGEQHLSVGFGDEKVAVIDTGSNGMTYFCVRLPANATASSPAPQYDTDFGKLTVSRSGPGYWKGEYGDPPGSLVLQENNGFLFGTWEQGSHEGYIIFALDSSGFNGYWWYAGQDSFNGHWNGTAVN